MQNRGSMGLQNFKIVILIGLAFALCGCTSHLLIRPESKPNVASTYEAINQKVIQELVQEKATATIVEDAVPVHRSPLLQSEIIHTLSKDSNYLISGRSSSGLWMALSIAEIPEGQGWVSTRYLAVVGAITAIEITDVPDIDPTMTWEVATIDIEKNTEEIDRLHVRIAPEPYARIVGYVNDGETYPILNRTEDGQWLQIPGTETIPTDNPVGGWIVATYTAIDQQSIHERLAPIKFTSQPDSAQEKVVITVPNNGRLLVRNAPRPDGNVMGYVSDGEVYRILDQSEENAWLLIDSRRDEDGLYSGWISGQFAAIQRPEPIYRPLVAYTSFSVPQDPFIQIQSGAPVLQALAFVVTPTTKPTATSTITPTAIPTIIPTVALAESKPIVGSFTYRTITPLAGSIRLAGKFILNVRYAPSQQSAVIGYIYNDEPINIQGYTANGEWYLVTGRARTANLYGGWIASELITIRDKILDIQPLYSGDTLSERMSLVPSSTAFDATRFFHSDKYRYALVNTGDLPLRIRVEPNTTAEVLTLAQTGELYIISSYTNDGQWIEISDFESRWIGWAAAEYLILIE